MPLYKLLWPASAFQLLIVLTMSLTVFFNISFYWCYKIQ